MESLDAAGPEQGWMAEMRRLEFEWGERLDFTNVTPDIEFVAFLRVHSHFGFFTFGPITIDVNLIEDILERTHPRGTGGPEHPPVSDAYVRYSNSIWAAVRTSGRRRFDELHMLLGFMRWPEGLPARVFGELGLRPEEVELYAKGLSSGVRSRMAIEPLYSTEEAAEYLGVHIQTVRSWIRSGKLPASRLAGQKSIRIRQGDLQRVLEPIDPSSIDPSSMDEDTG